MIFFQDSLFFLGTVPNQILPWHFLLKIYVCIYDIYSIHALTYWSVSKYTSLAVPINPSIELSALCKRGVNEYDVAPNHTGAHPHQIWSYCHTGAHLLPYCILRHYHIVHIVLVLWWYCHCTVVILSVVLGYCGDIINGIVVLWWISWWYYQWYCGIVIILSALGIVVLWYHGDIISGVLSCDRTRLAKAAQHQFFPPAPSPLSPPSPSSLSPSSPVPSLLSPPSPSSPWPLSPSSPASHQNHHLLSNNLHHCHQEYFQVVFN